MEDAWPTGPLLTTHPSSPGYADCEIAAQLASDAASSTTVTSSTVTSDSALTSSGEASSTPQTTPEVEDVVPKRTRARDVSAESNASSKQSGAAASEDSSHTTTRRRSMRLRTSISNTTTTTNASTPAANTTSAPSTPKTRSQSNTTSSTVTKTTSTTTTTTTRSKASTAATTPATTTTTTETTSIRRSLRSADVKPLPRKKEEPVARRHSTRVSALAAIEKIVITNTPSASAKRTHELMAAGSKSADAKLGGSSITPTGKKAKLDLNLTGKKGVKDVASSTGTPARGSEAPSASATAEEPEERPHKPKKRWISQGLYVGVDPELVEEPPLKPGSKKKQQQQQQKGKKKKQPALPLPILAGKTRMETVRDFKLPFFVFAPSPWKVGPIPDWRRLNHNVFIGDASQFWKKEKPSQIKCVCEDECNENCLNRCTWMECDDETCSVGRNCNNRAFADLKERVKSGTKFAEGVEVILTPDRGYGLRATRSFAPRQIIVEYTGEIITQEESERRMEEVYKDKKNYYLMLFDQNMILDATRGSVARFVNHSCEPNSRMEKWLVEGKPRMALFAGDDGVEAGDELTYDYNFNWFKGVTQQACKCGSEKCRGTLGKRTDALKAKPAEPKGTPKKKARVGRPPKNPTPATVPTKKRPHHRQPPKSAPPKPTALGPRNKQPPAPPPRSILLAAKPKRKPPTRRRPPTPPPPPPRREPSTEEEDTETETPAISPLKKVGSANNTPAVRKMRDRPRVTRTYKVGKTIAPGGETTRTATSVEKLKGALEKAATGARRLVMPLGA